MSASEPPTPDEIASEFPISPAEAEQIANAMSPLQRFTGIGDSVGATMEQFPGPGNRLVGAVLRNVSMQVNIAAQSVEMVARIIDFYVTAQGGAIEDLFPPPHVIAQDLQAQMEPASRAWEEEFGP